MQNQPKFEFKNQDDDVLDIQSDDEEEMECTINLAAQNLTKIPLAIAKTNLSQTTTLILTKNKISSFEHLDQFKSLNTLQLDRNHINDKIISTFPKMTELSTLWLNNNELTDLNALLSVLKKQCPKLEYLSLLFNPLCPFTQSEEKDEDETNAYSDYRMKVKTYLPRLKYLDISPLTSTKVKKEKWNNLLLHAIEIDKQSMKKSVIMKQAHLKKMISHCSAITHFSEWRCVYSTAIDGISQHTFYDELGKINEDKSILIIKDTADHIFGAYVDGANWKKSYRYKGSFDCFVFHFGGKYNKNNENLFIHKATGIEPYYLRCDGKDVTIGSGQSPALYFDMNFNVARTTNCKTFNSPPLTKTIDTQFTIKILEIWTPISK